MNDINKILNIYVPGNGDFKKIQNIKSGLKNQPTPNNLYRIPITLSQNRSILPHC